MNMEILSDSLSNTARATQVAPVKSNQKARGGSAPAADRLSTSALSRLLSASYRELAAAHKPRPEQIQSHLDIINPASIPDPAVDTIIQRMFGA